MIIVLFWSCLIYAYLQQCVYRIGIFSFGLSTPRTLAIATGVVLGFWGALTILLAFTVSLIHTYADFIQMYNYYYYFYL